MVQQRQHWWCWHRLGKHLHVDRLGMQQLQRLGVARPHRVVAVHDGVQVEPDFWTKQRLQPRQQQQQLQLQTHFLFEQQVVPVV
jgi:hypothetical protein